MPQYRVLPGHRHGKDDEYGPGDLVEMTEEEAQQFIGYKLEVIEDVKPPPQWSHLDGLSIPAILQMIDEGKITAQEAYDYETENQKRSTLLTALEDRILDEEAI